LLLKAGLLLLLLLLIVGMSVETVEGQRSGHNKRPRLAGCAGTRTGTDARAEEMNGLQQLNATWIGDR